MPPAAKEAKPTNSADGVEFICEDSPFSKDKPGRYPVLKDGSSDVSIGRLFDNKTMSKKHARLSFKGTKVFLTDTESFGGTWIKSIGALTPKTEYELEDGNTVVFGAKDDKSKYPDALRVKIKIIRSKPKPKPKSILKPSSDSKGKLDVPKISAPRSATPDSLKPPEVNKHRRTVSLEIPHKTGSSGSRSSSPGAKLDEKSSPAKTHSPDRKAPSTADKPKPTLKRHETKPEKPIATTELQREVKIPWSETFRLGFGVDALTGESTTRTALTTFKMNGSPRPLKAKISVDTLHWDGVKSFKDEYEMEIGGTVNVGAPVSMSTRVSSLLSQSTSSSTVLIEYKVVGEFEMEFVPGTVRLRDGKGDLPETEFREAFGDYYLAGCQRGYGCRMVIVCQVDEMVLTDSLEIEAKSLVENFFKAGAGHKKSKTKSKHCTMLHAMIETYGCSADTSMLSSGLLSVNDALKALPKLLKDPQGTPRVGLLYHYSALDGCKVPRSISVHREAFEKIHKMRDMYTQLQTYLEHPALQQYIQDCNRIRSACRAFENKRKHLVRDLKVDQKTKRLQDTPLCADLSSSKLRAETLIRRYTFIRGVKEMSKEYVRSPAVAGDNYFSWECGKVNGKLKKKMTDYNHVTFGGGFEAFEAEWESPPTKPPNPFNLKQIVRRTPERMTFVRTDVASKTGRVRDENESSDEGAFHFRLSGGRVYVIGWTLSCSWDGKLDPGPVIQVDDADNLGCILSDHFSVSLDTTRSTKWRCRVCFVFQSSYNFPELKLDQRTSVREPDINTDI